MKLFCALLKKNYSRPGLYYCLQDLCLKWVHSQTVHSVLIRSPVPTSYEINLPVHGSIPLSSLTGKIGEKILYPPLFKKLEHSRW